MPERVMVTGATGFIGSHVLRRLLDRGDEVWALGRRAPPSSLRGAVWLEADLLTGEGVKAAMEAIRPDRLVHLAWDARPGVCWTTLDNLDWTSTSLRLFRWFVEAGGRGAVFAGSCAEYDWSFDLLEEDRTPLRPNSLYGAAKASLSSLVQAAGAQAGIPVGWARIFYVYGPNEGEARLLPYVIRSLIRGEPALCSEGSQERDYMHVDDAASALLAVMDRGRHGAVNIASGDCVSVQRLVTLAADRIGRPDLLRLGARPTPAGDPPRLAASVDVLRDEIGFRPAFSLQRGVAETVDWWRGVDA